MSKVLAIAGMHRSGTSALTGYLHHCGLDIGDRLIGSTYGNPNGHFEDVEFEQIQEEILKNQGIVLRIKQDFKLEFTEEHKAAFKKLVEDRSHKAVWAWKDPRTSLFLNQWKELIPDLKVIAVYRRWDAVLSSLVRRARKQVVWWPKSLLVPGWHSGSNTWLMNRYLETWMRYNEDLLRFADQHPEDILFVQLGTAESDSFWSVLRDEWGFPLTEKKLNSVFREGEFRSGSEKWKGVTDKELASKAERIYRKLCQMELMANRAT